MSTGNEGSLPQYQPPQQYIGPYQIRGVLGKGGMAIVYRAYQPSLAREVAVKVITTAYTENPTFIERFQREARAIANLRHPNILTVHDFGQDPPTSQYYIVTELLEGGTLRERLTGQPLDLNVVASLLNQVAGALDYAHEAGIVHRDVKPANVLMDNIKSGRTSGLLRDRAVLSDFGIAKLLDETASNLTASGMGVIGTPAYMSPEQGMGEKLDGRSDQYSLAVMLYEMVTGTPPFRSDTPVGLMMAHATRPLPDPRLFNNRLNEQVVSVLQKALSKDRERRFASTNDLAQAFEAAINNRNVPPASGPNPSQWLKGPTELAIPPGAIPANPETTSNLRGNFGPGQLNDPTMPLSANQQPPNQPPGNWSGYPSSSSNLNPNPGYSAPPPGYGGPSVNPEYAAANQYYPTEMVRPDAVGTGGNKPVASNRNGLWIGLALLVLVLLIAAGVGLLLLTGNKTNSSTAAPAVASPVTASTSTGSSPAVATGNATNASNATIISAKPTLNSNAGPSSVSTGQAVVTNTSCTPVNSPEAGKGSDGFPIPPTPVPGANTGVLKLELLESNCVSARGRDVGVKVYKAGDRNTLVESDAGTNRSLLVLPAGNYEVVATYSNGVEVTGPAIEIKSGQTVPQTLNYGVGQLKLQIFESTGKSAKGRDVILKVYRAGDRNTLITEDAGNNVYTVVLRPGNYDIWATYANGVEVMAEPLSIKEGQTISQTINFGIGHLTLNVLESTSGKSARGRDVSVKVYRAGDRNTLITEDAGNNKFDLVVKPGSYEVVAGYANGVEVASRPLEIKEGQDTTSTTTFGVGSLQMDITEKSGQAAKDSDITVKVFKSGDRGNLVTQDSGSSKLNFVLKPGNYELVINYRDNPEVVSGPVEIKEGQTVTQPVKV